MTNLVYLSLFDSDGRPTSINTNAQTSENIQYSVTTDLENEYLTYYPEGQSVVNTHQEWVKDNDMHFIGETNDVYVTFVTEAAGYRNSFGCFTYPTDNPPRRFNDLGKDGISDLLILFPNTSKPGSGGNLSPGDSVHIPYSWTTNIINGKKYVSNPNYTFPAGVSLGFVLISNAWNGNSVTGTRAKYFTSSYMNPERSESLKYHCVAVRSEIDTDVIFMGFEDVNRHHHRCDHDFNDCVVIFRCSPLSNVSPHSYATPVVYDYHKGTIIVEDLYHDNPTHDIDYNDVVGEYAIREGLLDNKVTTLDYTFHLKARGADYDHEFGFSVPHFKNITGTAVRRTWKHNETVPTVEDISSIVFKTGNTNGRVQLISSTKDLLPNLVTGMSNTLNELDTSPSTVSVSFTFDTPISRSDMGAPPYGTYAITWESGIRGVIGSSKPLHDYTDTTKLPTVSTNLNAFGITHIYNILVLKDWTHYRVIHEKKPIYRPYPWIIEFLKSDKQDNQNWFTFMREGRLHGYVENPTRDGIDYQ